MGLIGRSTNRTKMAICSFVGVLKEKRVGPLKVKRNLNPIWLVIFLRFCQIAAERYSTVQLFVIYNLIQVNLTSHVSLYSFCAFQLQYWRLLSSNWKLHLIFLDTDISILIFIFSHYLKICVMKKTKYPFSFYLFS